MPYQHPLAYLLGLEGLALLHGWAGDYDKEFVRARLAEVRRLLDHEPLASHAGVDVRRGDAETGYRTWSATYDDGRNSLFDIDEPVVFEIVDGLPKGSALDAACGSGRFAEYLAAQGHQVIGVDSSADLLARARSRVPDTDFRLGDLHDLPVPDGSADLVVSGLALSHVPALGPVMAEFARVLRPGGHLVISDLHHEQIFRGSVVKAVGPAGEPGLVATYRHTPGDFLRAALPVGLQVRRCEEPGRPDRTAGRPAPEIAIGDWTDWPWSLAELVPEAVRAAWATPPVIIWQFQLAGAG
jgi:SAM-dependent methyltransferase